MNANKIIKSTYHSFALLILLFVAITFLCRPYFTNKRINIFIIVSLVLIALFHAYDVWWFYYKEGPAPI